MPICETCLDSVAEEYGSDDMTALYLLIQEMGADLADHRCDRVETNGEIECSCPGHRELSLV
jgi:hypothetical protein